MVAVTYTLNLGNTEALNKFDNVQYMAFGDNNTAASSGNTGLGNELLRVIMTADQIVKNAGSNTYSFTGRVPITQLNSSTIREIGLFEDNSGAPMAARIISPIELTKTSDDEILITILITVSTINN